MPSIPEMQFCGFNLHNIKFSKKKKMLLNSDSPLDGIYYKYRTVIFIIVIQKLFKVSDPKLD
jgi:hypothetical protein